MYGHTRNWCKEEVEYCRDCAKPRHDGEKCTEKRCRNCPNGGNPPHGSLANDCPIRKMEIEIAHLKIDNGVSYGMAKKMYLDKVKNNPSSYAEMAKSMAEKEVKENTEKLAEVTKARENAEKILEQLEIETEKLKKIATAILRKKQERDNLRKLIEENTEPEATTSVTVSKPISFDPEDMDTEPTDSRKRGPASTPGSEEEDKSIFTHPPRKILFKKKVEKNPPKNEYLITPENYEKLPDNLKKIIRKAIEKYNSEIKVKDPLNPPPCFWNNGGKILSGIAENEEEVELYEFIIPDGH